MKGTVARIRNVVRFVDLGKDVWTEKMMRPIVKWNDVMQKTNVCHILESQVKIVSTKRVIIEQWTIIVNLITFKYKK